MLCRQVSQKFTFAGGAKLAFEHEREQDNDDLHIGPTFATDTDELVRYARVSLQSKLMSAHLRVVW
jgi:hypothetical protein